MPKIMKPILDMKVKVSKITMATLKVDLSTIIRIFKYKGVNRDWARYNLHLKAGGVQLDEVVNARARR